MEYRATLSLEVLEARDLPSGSTGDTAIGPQPTPPGPTEPPPSEPSTGPALPPSDPYSPG